MAVITLIEKSTLFLLYGIRAFAIQYFTIKMTDSNRADIFLQFSQEGCFKFVAEPKTTMFEKPCFGLIYIAQLATKLFRTACKYFYFWWWFTVHAHFSAFPDFSSKDGFCRNDFQCQTVGFDGNQTVRPHRYHLLARPLRRFIVCKSCGQ